MEPKVHHDETHVNDGELTGYFCIVVLLLVFVVLLFT